MLNFSQSDAFALLAAVCAASLWGTRVGAPFRRTTRWLAAREWRSLLFVGSFSLLVNIGIACSTGWPVPSIHDEFSYLLAADTFAEGRVTNPTHPLWEHFETFHVLQRPSYQSKFPPGMGLVLAAGKVLSGQPIVGVWFCFAAACMATTWMLRAWVSPRFALIGGLLPAITPGVINWWGQSYWGGALAMLGGALLFGSLKRLVQWHCLTDAGNTHSQNESVFGVRQAVARHVALFALGLVLLANSRPYEGVVATIPAIVLLASVALRERSLLADRARLLVPAAAVLLTGAVAMLSYNRAVTGSATRLPYQVYEETYTRRASLGATLFSWSDLSATPRPSSNLPLPTDSEEGRLFRKSRASEQVAKTYRLGKFYIGLPLLVPLALFPWILLNRWMRFALATVLLTLVAVVAQRTAGHPHYAAPVYCLLLALVAQGLRHLRAWNRTRSQETKIFEKAGLLPSGRLLHNVVIAAMVALFAVRLADWRPIAHKRPWSLEREQMVRDLEADGSRHLVIVRYGPEHSPHQEWVYNRADIDSATVVFARDLGSERNQRLLDYFANRRIWLLEPDVKPQHTIPYVTSTTTETRSHGEERATNERE